MIKVPKEWRHDYGLSAGKGHGKPFYNNTIYSLVLKWRFNRQGPWECHLTYIWQKCFSYFLRLQQTNRDPFTVAACNAWNNNSKLTPIGPLQAQKIATSVLFSVFQMAFRASFSAKCADVRITNWEGQTCNWNLPRGSLNETLERTLVTTLVQIPVETLSKTPWQLWWDLQEWCQQKHSHLESFPPFRKHWSKQNVSIGACYYY